MINKTGYTLEELKKMGIEFGKIVTFKDMPAFKTPQQVENEESSK
jgi:hypothetical protein